MLLSSFTLSINSPEPIIVSPASKTLEAEVVLCHWCGKSSCYTGKISLAWDLWSLAVVIVKTLTGKHPFAGNTMQEMMQQVTTIEVPLFEELPVVN